MISLRMRRSRVKSKSFNPSAAFFVISAIWFFCGCKTSVKTLPAGDTIRADVVSFDPASVQAVSDAPKFIYGPQTFSRITDINALSGSRLKMLQGGDLEIQETLGSVILSNQFGGFTIPNLDYRIANGIVKPTTSKSLTMLSAIYNFDTLVGAVESLTGIPENEFFKTSADLSVIYHPAVKVTAGGEVVKKYETTNAAYLAGSNQFALFMPGREEQVAMAYNAQIIAHEFGHSIFERSFFNNKFDRCTKGNYVEQKLFPGRLEQEFTVRGLNEGFADFVSFVWTGSGNILQSSLGISPATRERNFALIGFDYDDYSYSGSDICTGGYYCLGTLWAKTLFEVYQSRGLDPKNFELRKEFLRETVQLMSEVGKSLREFDGDRLPKPDEKMSKCEVREGLSPSYDEDLLAVFFEAVIENTETSKRKGYCDAISKYFGQTAFPDSARGDCK